MKNILAIALAICFSTASLSQEKPRPADQDKCYLTIVTHSDWAKRPAEKKLIEDVKSRPMVGVAQKCHFNHITTSDEMYKSRWAAIYPENRLPALILQDAKGGYYFKGSGPNVPSGSQHMFDTLKAYKEMAPDDRVKAFVAMDSILEPPPLYEPEAMEDETLNRRRPWRSDSPPDSAELFGGQTPVRDSLSSAVMIFLAVLAIGLVICLGVMALIAFFITVKYWK